MGKDICLECDIAMEAESVCELCQEIKALKAQLAAERWIPVEEGLPVPPKEENDEGLLVIAVKPDRTVNVLYLFPESNCRIRFKAMGYTHWRKITLPGE